MTDYTQHGWRVYTSGLNAEQRKQAFRDLAINKHRVTDETAKPLNFSSGSTTATVASAPPTVERKVIAPHYRTPASLETIDARREPVQLDRQSSGLGRLSKEDELSFNAFMRSFQSLSPKEKEASTQKLIEVYSARLIHD